MPRGRARARTGRRRIPAEGAGAFEAAIGLLAAAILTGMVFWMRKAALSIRSSLHGQIDAALAHESGGGLALVADAFLAVAREGLESVVFLLAAFQQEEVGLEATVGALLGLAVAVAIGVAIFRFGRSINLRRFFRWTGVLIIFVAAGLLAGAMRSAHEAGLWNQLQGLAYDLSDTLPVDSFAGTLLSGLFGYRDAPSASEAIVYIVYIGYLVPTLLLFLRGRLRSAQPAGQMRNA